MLRRLFGRENIRKHKKRLSPSASTAEGIAQSHPMYQYALNEYSQTVEPGTTNDDGRSVISQFQDDEDYHHQSVSEAHESQQPSLTPSPTNISSSRTQEETNLDGKKTYFESIAGVNAKHDALPPISPPEPVFGQPSSIRQDQLVPPPRSPLTSRIHEPTMPDATYEETYGDAYVGGPIKYVYPSGYQSMRPRGGPWKLSIAICVSFTWLSVFIIGHCSDRVDQSLYDLDDDTLAIETRWCGSRLLYMMWVISMLITGLATAYCSVIGYIKVRDFAVANARSQPPGMVGKSDYYIKIEDNFHSNAFEGRESSGSESSESKNYSLNYHRTIYQSDGMPQFWGGHIYRPTQAAVAITSR